MDKENLGPAERIIQSLISYTDHMIHNRPGMLMEDPTSAIGVKWEPVTHKEEDGGQKVVYKGHLPLNPMGGPIRQPRAKGGKIRKNIELQRVGVMQPDGQIVEGGRVIARYQPAGIFAEVAVWMYQQVAEVWKLDNEFAAHWASWSFGQNHRDQKVILTAFMLCQSRKGDPVMEDGKVAFCDEDFRDVGEAMILTNLKKKDTKKDSKDKDHRDMDAKMILRVYNVLRLPGIAAINRELGFGRSARKPFLGRWDSAVRRWLRFREQNPKVLQGLVKAGFKTTVMELSRRAQYKPETTEFFRILGWEQTQAKEGHRKIAIGEKMVGESWEGLNEEQVCQRIVQGKMNWKQVVGRLPEQVGVTRAVMAAAIEAGSLSDKDLVILTPTLEELGLLTVQDVRERWERAVKAADDMRAANVARNVRSKETREKLQEGADVAMQKAIEEVVRGIRTYVFVDVSGSMEGAIEAAKSYVAKFLQGFPPDRVHVAVFSTKGREVRIPHPTAAGVTNAFRGIVAGGGTDYGHGILCLSNYVTTVDEDALFVFIGDERNKDQHDLPFADSVRAMGITPMAFGLVRVGRNPGIAVQSTAAQLGIPCFLIDEATFADPYAIPRTIRALVAATPVGVSAHSEPHQKKRVSLVDQILDTPLLLKPAWALAA